MPAVAVVPAAGKGERFGGDKLLALVGADTLLDRTLRSLLDAAIDRIILVVGPASDFSIVKALADSRVQIVRNPDPSRGMFSSIQCGLERADGDPVLVLPADMPFVRSTTVATVIGACGATGPIVLPTYLGKHGHPVGFPAPVRATLLAASPASTLKAALASTGLKHLGIPVDDPGVLRDVDVPSDL